MVLVLANNAVTGPQAKVENCGWLIPKGDELVPQPDASLKPSDQEAPLPQRPSDAKAAYCDRDTPTFYVGDIRMTGYGFPLIIRSGGDEGVLENSPEKVFTYHRAGDRYLPDFPLPIFVRGPSSHPWAFLQAHRTIILVRVVKSDPVSPSAYATVVVLKSWKGPFSAGRILDVGPPDHAITWVGKWPPDLYLFRPSGDKELLIMTDGETEPLILSPEAVSPSSKSQIVDQAVKEVQQWQDPQTDIVRGPARQRVMLGLMGCMAAAIDEIGRRDSLGCRFGVNLAVLFGIKRSELVAYWGPPTFCLRGSPLVDSSYSAPTGPDCPTEEMPIWTFGHPDTTLYCITGEKNNLRCMDFSWDYGAPHFHGRAALNRDSHVRFRVNAAAFGARVPASP
jgi:hypothetical protein